MRELFLRIFTLDRRSLALMRIGVGGAIAYDVIERFFAISTHFPAEGLDVLHPFSIYFHAIGTPVLPWLLSLHLLVAVALAIGWKTRLATVGAFYLSWCFVAAFPMIRQGIDIYAVAFTLIGIFLPWGERYSVDARGSRKPLVNGYFSAATVLLIIQLAAVYLTAASSKLTEPYWRDGSALYYVLKAHPTWVTNAVDSFTAMIPAMSYFVILGQLSILLAFAPSRRLKLIPYICNSLLHLGMALTLKLGPFPIIALAALQCLFPFWIFRGEEKEDAPERGGMSLVPTILAVLIAVCTVEKLYRMSVDVGYASKAYAALARVSLLQDWTYYVPISPAISWYTVIAKTDAGEFDFHRQGVPADDGWEKNFVARGFLRWYYVLELGRQVPPLRESVARAFCDVMKERGPRSVEIDYHRRPIVYGGQMGEVERIPVLRADCFPSRNENIRE